MNRIDKKLVSAYALLVRAGRVEYDDIKNREIVLNSGEKTTLIDEIKLQVAIDTISILEE